MVNRYEIDYEEIQNYGAECISGDDLVSSANGDIVLYEDYVVIEAENERLKDENAELMEQLGQWQSDAININEEFKAVKAENERLREALAVYEWAHEVLAKSMHEYPENITADGDRELRAMRIRARKALAESEDK